MDFGSSWGSFTDSVGSAADLVQGRGSTSNGLAGVGNVFGAGIGAGVAGPLGALAGVHLGSFLNDIFSPLSAPTPQTPGAPPDQNQIRQMQLDQQLANEKNQAQSNTIQTTASGLSTIPQTSRILLSGQPSVNGASLRMGA